jgi:23S rRNA pseudouridine2605 synthase
MKRPFAKFEAKYRALRPAPKPDSDRPQRPEGKTYKPRPTDGADPARPDRPQRPERPEKRFDAKPRPPRTFDADRPQRPDAPEKRFDAKPRPPRTFDADRPQRPDAPEKRFDAKPRPPRTFDADRPQRPDAPEKRFDAKPRPPRAGDNNRPPSRNDRPGGTPFKREKPQFMPKIEEAAPEAESNRLNKFMADCGICSRRAAQIPIEKGEVAINGTVIKEIGYRVMREDVVTYKDKVIKPNTRKIYILLNKPKDTITTADDPEGRATVMDIVGKTVKTRIFPVGRLDRNTTGLLLLTNDGDLALKLSHPSYQMKKIYQVKLNKYLSKNHLDEIRQGVPLEDGKVHVTAIDYIEGGQKSEVGVEIHIGKNRIVRRIFEHFGYEIDKLDRVYYAGLTKKDLPRSTYRHLTEREVIMLKHFAQTKLPIGE